MQYPNIIDIGSYLGSLMPIKNAIQSGKYTLKEQDDSQYQSIAIEDNLYPADMVLKALEMIQTNDIHGLTYTHIHVQGQSEFWSPASYIARKLNLSSDILAYNLRQGCNGMMLAIQLACARIKHHKKLELVLCGDRFNISSFNRWGADYGIVYGDGACAITLGYSNSARFEIIHLASKSAWDLEELHRDIKFQHLDSYNHFDIKQCKKQFLQTHGKDFLQNTTSKNTISLAKQLEVKSNVKITEIDAIIVPNLGSNLLYPNYLSPLGLDKINNSVVWGSTVGHLGCGDCIIGLNELDNAGRYKKGDKILLVGAGAGFSWTFMLVRKL